MKFNPFRRFPLRNVVLNGGLGNQLFGWALAESLALIHTENVTVSVENLSSRGYGLGSFNLNVEPHIRKNRVSKNFFPIRIFRRLTEDYFKPSYLFKESSFNYDEKVFDSRFRNFQGYFQSWKYFDFNRNDLVQQLRILRHPSVAYEDLCEKLQRKPFVTVHVRRGDYVQLTDYHGIASAAYYQYARTIMDKMLDYKDSNYVVFSDDLDEAKKVFPNANLYIGNEHLADPAENLLLMSHGIGFIGANSSFSWWAAYIGDPEDRPIIFPRPWFREKSLNTDDLLLPSWITVGNF
jgi:Glycosyl transferase family 11